MKERIQGDGVSPDLDAQQRTQAAETGGVSTGTIRETDIAEGERVTKENLTESGINYLNAKRTYDEYQEAGLVGIKQNQRVFEQSAAQLQANLAAVNQLTIQHLQNAVTVANRINNDAAGVSNLQNTNVAEVSNKTNNRAGRHEDVAIEGQWSPVAQGTGDATLLAGLSKVLDDLKAEMATMQAKMAKWE